MGQLHVAFGRALLLVLSAAPANAQVEARQATPDEVAQASRGPGAVGNVEMKNPMLLEVPVIRKDGSSVFASWLITPRAYVSGWSTTETARFVCDRARVEKVEIVEKKKARKGKPARHELILQVASDWFRQDVDISVTLKNPDGEVLAKGFWNDLTIGNDVGFGYGGFTRRLKIPLEPSAEKYAELVSETRPLLLSIVVEIQGEKGDAGGD